MQSGTQAGTAKNKETASVVLINRLNSITNRAQDIMVRLTALRNRIKGGPPEPIKKNGDDRVPTHQASFIADMSEFVDTQQTLQEDISTIIGDLEDVF